MNDFKLTGNQRDIPLMEVRDGNTVLFHPHMPKNAKKMVSQVLDTRWIGQGPLVDKFEKDFSNRFCDDNKALAVGSGTDALHLAYMLAGIKPGDEVAVPLFTCTATNLPLLYMGAKLKFIDINPSSLNIDVEHLRASVNERTKAIVVVHYGGFPCDMDEILEIAGKFGIPVIEDAAHAVGTVYKGRPVGTISDFTMFSFQAIKHITTGDGGLLTFKDASLDALGRRLRWFGIDRSSKQLGIWENDIKEIGYKYQMTDIGAAMGLAALEEWDETHALRLALLKKYEELIQDNEDIQILGRSNEDIVHGAWLCTVRVKRRKDLQEKLWRNKIETNQVHYRNDRYSVFGGRQKNFPNMDAIEDEYLVLPLHTKMELSDVERIAEIINSGW
jgi:dTDP-4-amino-4,6-dideoxygalactose transaminase